MIEEINGFYLYRNDKVNIFDVNGMKSMSALHLIQQARELGYKNIVSVGSRYSPQCDIISDLCQNLKLYADLFMPNCKEDTSIMKKIISRCNSTIHKIDYGYTSNLIFNAKKFAYENNFYYIDFGMRNMKNIDFISERVKDIPNLIKRIVCPIGSGVNFLGILYGLEKYERYDVELVGVITGSIESKKYIEKNLPIMCNVNYKILTYAPDLNSSNRYKKRIDFNIDEVVLNPLYEAKCGSFLNKGDLLWIVGS